MITKIFKIRVKTLPIFGVSVAILLTGTLIIVNMVSLQPGPHPAPLFGEKTLVEDQPTSTVPDFSPLFYEIKEALKATDYYEETRRQSDQYNVTLAIQRFQIANNLPVTGEPSESILAQILLNHETNTTATNYESDGDSTTKITLAVQVNEQSTVWRVQQALASLGYGPLDVDGILGLQTSKAIEQFELDRGLPITGEPSEVLLQEFEEVGVLPILGHN